jgi:hypothetical protein
MADEYIIGQELADDILEYLQKCPYKDVTDLIDGLRKLPKKV